MPTPTTTGGHHVCSYCKRRDDEPHGPGCKNPKAEGNRGPAKKASAPRRVELRVSRGGNSIATDLRAVPTPELVAALERGLNELARRLAVLDQVREVIG